MPRLDKTQLNAVLLKCEIAGAGYSPVGRKLIKRNLRKVRRQLDTQIVRENTREYFTHKNLEKV
jgi:hypothetical protein